MQIQVVVEDHSAELVIGMKEVGSEGTSEVKSKGLGGPMAGKTRQCNGRS